MTALGTYFSGLRDGGEMVAANMRQKCKMRCPNFGTKFVGILKNTTL